MKIWSDENTPEIVENILFFSGQRTHIILRKDSTYCTVVVPWHKFSTKKE